MKKIILIILGLIIIIGGFVAYLFYKKIYQPNVIQTSFIFIPSQADFNKVSHLIQPYLNNQSSFVWVAHKKNYPNKIRAGKFKISKGMNNNDLVDHLRGGKPETIKVTFNNQDTFEGLAGRIAQQIEADSVSVLKAIQNKEFQKKNNFNSNTALAMYIPNSYEFYWNTSAVQFRNRILKEYRAFWNKKRVAQAKKQNLSQIEVSTLASIVQKETATVKERPKVAGLYLNRLHNNWPLQADPTIIFALKEKNGKNFEIKRVLNKDLKIDSPYNTYENLGLPPGPIGMPDISSLKAVLNPEQHRYFYMCASVTNIGEHEFATSLRQHNINAKKYQKWITKQGIKR